MYDHIETNEKTYFILEYAAGGDLLEHINKKGPLRETDSKRLFSQLMAAIGYCHTNNVIHRLVQTMVCYTSLWCWTGKN